MKPEKEPFFIGENHIFYIDVALKDEPAKCEMLGLVLLSQFLASVGLERLELQVLSENP